MTQPVPITSELRTRDDVAGRTQDTGCGAGKAMVDSYLSSFNSLGITSPRLEDLEDDEVFHDNVPSDHPFRPHTKGRAPPVPTSPPPHLSQSRYKPPFQRLEQLPGLSIVTWEEFVDNPSVLCGLFELDRSDFIHYNSEQVNVFFHDSRMDQPTLGAPSGDGLSWTIFIDNYNHLRTVRNWLTERVSVILLQLFRPKGEGAAACLVAINPANKSVGQELQSSFSRAIESFLRQRNFSVELNLNSCVQTWCRTVLKMPCAVRGGRLVVTNADECVPCSRVDNVPFCVLCFPVWGVQKLAYRFKRRSEYDDFFLYFKAEDLALCTKSPQLKKYTEHNNNSRHMSDKSESIVTSQGTKARSWIKKNRQSVTAATQTLESGEDAGCQGQLSIEERTGKPFARHHMDLALHRRVISDRYLKTYAQSLCTGEVLRCMQVEDNDKEVFEDDEGLSNSISASRHTTGRGKHSGLSSASTSTDRLQAQVDREQLVSASKTNLLSRSTVSASTSYSSSVLSPEYSAEPSLQDGAHILPVSSASWKKMQGLDDDDDSLNLPTPRTPRTPREDPRGAGFDPVSTLPAVGSDDEHGNYRLLADTPSPRPDTPFHKQLPPQSLRVLRPSVLSQEVIVDETLENGEGTSVDDKVQLKGGTADVPSEPGSKQRKKRISKVLRDISSTTGWQPSTALYSQAHGLRADEGGFYARENKAFVPDELSDGSFRQLKSIDKVKYTPITDLKDKKSAGQKAFPYTSELLDFVGENTKNKTSYSPLEQVLKKQEAKSKKKKSAVEKKAEDMLFAPRFRLGEDRHDRNCLSDNDIGDDDYDDMEPDSVMSDVEGVASPRLIPVKKTTRTISVNSVLTPRSDADTDWEITDCELDEETNKQDGPKILPGAKGAQQLRATSAHKTRESSAHSGDGRRRGGVQNDSRRRYIALNSLRRKANQLALQAELRKQKRPDSSSSTRMELMEV